MAAADGSPHLRANIQGIDLLLPMWHHGIQRLELSLELPVLFQYF